MENENCILISCGGDDGVVCMCVCVYRKTLNSTPMHLHFVPD